METEYIAELVDSIEVQENQLIQSVYGLHDTVAKLEFVDILVDELIQSSLPFGDDYIVVFEKRIEALFMMIYTVRCNLFHGSKEASNPRDVRLVQRSGEILEIYLEGTSARPSIEYGTGEKEQI